MALDFLGLLGAGADKKFLLRDFRNAARLTPGVNPPRQKFEGYVNFILNRDLYNSLYGDSRTNEFRTQISSLLRTADLPSVVFQTETKNAFNKKKIVNTGVTYNPVSMTVFDTVGNEWITTLMKYFSYHFMDPRNQQKAEDRDIYGGQPREGGVDNMNSSYGMGGEGTWDSNIAGYNLNNSAQFFERIDYVLYHGNKGVQYSIINPVMTQFKPGGIDYSSSDVQEFQLDFEYERFTVYNKLNFELGAEDVDRFEELGAITGDLFDEDVIKPTVLTTERELGILGTEETPRNRSFQPVVAPAPVEETDDETSQEDSESDGTGDDTQETETDSTELKSTYSQSYDTNQMSGASDSYGSSVFDDILGNVADSALSAVLRGQNVKDAVIGTAVSLASSAIGSAINEQIAEEDAIDPSSPNQSPAEDGS